MLRLTIPFAALLLFSVLVRAQDSPGRARPMIGIEADSVSFYDRLDMVLKDRRLDYYNKDTSFNWMVGNWSIQAKGYAKSGFRGKREFEWTAPAVSFVRDQNYSIFAVTGDTVLLTDQYQQRRSPLPAQLILQYDVYGKVWVLQPGYNNRYDWGSLISEGWEGDQIRFDGAISITGIRVIEKETWTRASNNEFRIVYEQKLNDGTWFKVEENIYRRNSF